MHFLMAAAESSYIGGITKSKLINLLRVVIVKMIIFSVLCVFLFAIFAYLESLNLQLCMGKERSEECLKSCNF